MASIPVFNVMGWRATSIFGQYFKLSQNFLFGLFFLFNVPVNNFSVMLGRSHRFLGIYQYFGELSVLLKDTTRRSWGSNHGPLPSESDALPRSHLGLFSALILLCVTQCMMWRQYLTYVNY